MAFTLDLGNLICHLKMDDTLFNRSFLGVERNLDRVVGKLTAFGLKMTAAFTAPLTLLARQSVKSFGSFDDAMTKSLAIMQNITPQMRKQMEQVVFGISKDSVTPVTELAKGYFYLASAGLNAQQSMKALAAVNSFAVAGNFNLAQATSLAMDSQSSLGLRVQDSEQNMRNLVKVTDTLTGANTLANATIQQFAEALGNEAGAAMKNWNIRLEEGVAILAAYANQSVKGQVAGSDFSRLIRMLTQTYQENEQAWKNLGLELFDDRGFFRLTGLIEDLSNKLKDLSPEARAATMNLLGFQARTMQVVLPLIGATDQIKEYTERLGKMSGLTVDVEKKNRSWSDTLYIMWKQLDAVRRSIGEIVTQQLAKLKPIIDSIVIAWESLSQPMKEFIVKALMVVAAIGPASLLMAGFVKTLASLAGMVGLVMSPLGLITGAILYLALSSETVATAFGRSFDSMGEAVKFLSDKVRNWTAEDTKRIEFFIRMVKVEIDRMIGYFQSFVSYLRQDYTGATSAVWQMFLAGMELAAKAAIDLSIRTGKGIWEGLKKGIFGEVTLEVQAEAGRRYQRAGGRFERAPLEHLPKDRKLYEEYVQAVVLENRNKITQGVYAGMGQAVSQYAEDYTARMKEILRTTGGSGAAGGLFVNTLRDVDAVADSQKEIIRTQEQTRQFLEYIKEVGKGQYNYFKSMYDGLVKPLQSSQQQTVDNTKRGMSDLEGLLDEVNEAYQKRLATMAEITSFDLSVEGAYEAQLNLLKNQAVQYRQILGDVKEIQLWLERQTLLLDIAAGKSGTIAQQLRAANEEMKLAVKDAGGRWYQFARELPDLFEQGFMRMTQDMRNWADAAKQMLKEIYYEALRIAFIRPMAEGMAGIFSSVGSAIGSSLFPNAVSATANTAGNIGNQFDPGPWLENTAGNIGNQFDPGPGLGGMDEGGIAWRPTIAALAEKGRPELVTPLDQVKGLGLGGSVTVNVINESGVPLDVSRQEQYTMSDERIIDVVVSRSQTDSRLQRALGTRR